MFTILALQLSLAFAHDLNCIPKDEAHKHIQIHVADAGIESMTESAFEDAIAKVMKKFESVVKKDHDANLVINNLWTDATINAQAYQEWHEDPITKKITKYFMVDAFGGLARYPGMTKNGFIAVLCHELGHHIGGAPKYNRNGWASIEGQSDYWATHHCMKELGIDSKAAGKALAGVLADLNGERPPKESSPDMTVVTKMLESHPEAQCRLDTYLAGRACTQTGKISQSDPKQGTCHVYPAGKAAVGDRPLCWFKP